MIRAFGVLLIFLGGAGFARLETGKRRKELATVGELLYAAHRLEREIRCESRPLPELFSSLQSEVKGDARRFFEQLLFCWEQSPESELLRSWESSLQELSLPAEGERIWRELGRHFAGDGESLRGALCLAAEERTALQQRLELKFPDTQRVSTAVFLSASAFLAILLL